MKDSIDYYYEEEEEEEDNSSFYKIKTKAWRKMMLRVTQKIQNKK